MAKQRDASSVSVLGSLMSPGLYKQNQGRIVRQVSFFAFLIIALLIAWHFGDVAFVAELISGDQGTRANWICLAIFGSVGAWVCFRMIHHPPFADFLIAVEAEMNKVSWPTWPELWRASLVVIFVIFAMALSLFLFDVVWSWFFGQIGVRYVI